MNRRLLHAALLLISILCFTAPVKAQKGTIGIGVKAGDPTGISLKLYSPENPIELVIGRGYYFNGWYDNYSYYEERFNNYPVFSGKGYKFERFTAGTPVAIQVHWLKQQPLKSYKGFDWYLGAGPQFRAYKVSYYYREYYGSKGHEYVTGREDITDYDLGIDGLAGLEYNFIDLPVSIFTDVNLFLEIIDQPFMLNLQGGIGVRYNLK